MENNQTLFLKAPRTNIERKGVFIPDSFAIKKY